MSLFGHKHINVLRTTKVNITTVSILVTFWQFLSKITFFCGKGIWSKAQPVFNRKYERSLAVTSSIYTFPLSMCGCKIMNVLLLILSLFNYVMNLHEETQSVKCFLLKKIFYLNHAQIRCTMNRCFKIIPK